MTPVSDTEWAQQRSIMHLLRDALQDAFGGYHMGITAENIAQDWGLTREQLDEFAAWRHEQVWQGRGGNLSRGWDREGRGRKKKETDRFNRRQS